jgi:signal recognition particle receptor subunit beta
MWDSMGKVNAAANVVTLKIVYFGAGGVGKTTNLERLQTRASEVRPGELVVKDDGGDRTLMFEWTPVTAGKVASYDVRIEVHAIAGKAKNESTKRKLLRDADGIVFVLDSSPAQLGENRTAWGELSDHLSSLGLARERVPLVIQLNKRDMPNAMNGDDLRARLGMGGFPVVEAVAKGGAGVGPTLLDITRRALRRMSDPAYTNGEPMSAVEISRLDATALPDAFTACGLLPRRASRPMQGVGAAEEISVTAVSRRYDSPSPPKALPPRDSVVRATPQKEMPTQKLQAATLIATLSREMANQPPAPTAKQSAEMATPVATAGPPRRESAATKAIDSERPTSPPPSAHPASQERELGGDDPERIRDLVVESEARVMARLAQIEDQIAELRGLVTHVAEQLRRVSTAPPVSEQRVVHLVKDAIGALEQQLKAK